MIQIFEEEKGGERQEQISGKKMLNLAILKRPCTTLSKREKNLDLKQTKETPLLE